jgi:hypothetical protein
MAQLVASEIRAVRSGGTRADTAGDGSVNLRHRAFAVLEHWHAARETAVVKPTHPLVTVQEMRLESADGKGTVYAKQKRTSGSFPPIRDMDYLSRRVDEIMAHIGAVEPLWRKALELHCQHGSVRKAAKAISKYESQHGRLTQQLWRQFDQGLAVLQSELVRNRL